MKLIRDALAARRAREALARDLTAAFGREAPQGLSLIKDGPQARVAAATWQGEPVILKQFHTPDPAGFMAGMSAEHDRLRALFPHGALRAGLMRAQSAPHAIAVLEKAPGERLDAVLDHADADQRATLVAQAGAWLGRALGEERDTGTFFPRFWIERLEAEITAAPLPAPDRDLTLRAHRGLRRLGRALRHGPVPRGPIHADFAPHNIFHDAASGTLWVFDIQKTTHMPLGLDIARLLVGLSVQMQRQHPDCALQAGVLAADRRALLAAQGLEHPLEALPFVDFFLGHRLIKALIDKHAHPDAPIFRRSLENWLKEAPCP